MENSVSTNNKIPIIYDECEEGLLPYENFKVRFGEQVFETSVTNLNLQGADDNVLKMVTEKKYINRLFITGDKEATKSVFSTNSLSSATSSSYNPDTLVICFTDNTYTLEKKRFILNRLFRTKGFKFKDIYYLLRRYAIIWVSDKEIRYLLRKNNILGNRPLYNRL